MRTRGEGRTLDDDRKSVEELSRHFFREISRLRKDEAGIDDIAITPLVDAWFACLDWAVKVPLADDQMAAIASAGASAAEQYGIYGQTHGNNKRNALLAMRGYLDAFWSLFEELESAGFEHPDIEVLRKKLVRAGDEAEQALGVMVYVSERVAKLDQAVRAAEEAAREAKDAVALAQKAATESSTSTLEASFETTATNNNRVAWAFRFATIGVLILVVGLGSYFAVDHTPVEGESVDWYGIVYRVAVLSGLGAIAAYLGRQAGNYGRLATWAHGIRIQLKAFLGFVNEIENEDARQSTYTLFGKRVLESPPDGKSSPEDSPTNLIQPIFEQAAKLQPPQ